MATSNDVINLSDIPVPDAIVVPDAAELFSRWLTRLRELDPEFNALVESDPVYKQGEVNAWQLTLAMQRVNDAVRAVLLASAGGTDLDQLGANYDVFRQIIVPEDLTTVPPTEPVYESDDAFREKIQLSWSELSVAGPRNAYRSFAGSADPDVLDAEAYGPETHALPGEVKIFVLSRTGNGVASDALCNRVYDVLNADEVRPLTDYVEVKPAGLIRFSVKAALEIPEGPDRQTVYANAVNALNNYLKLSHRIGNLIPLSAIYAVLHQPGVTRVILESPTSDILAATGKAPWCEEIAVKIAEAKSG